MKGRLTEVAMEAVGAAVGKLTGKSKDMTFHSVALSSAHEFLTEVESFSEQGYTREALMGVVKVFFTWGAVLTTAARALEKLASGMPSASPALEDKAS